MTRVEAYRGLSIGIAVLMTAFFGFASVASAQVANIMNTGPNSNNTISAINSAKCTVTNNNDLSAKSINNQKAVTGDATSSHNTNAGFSSAWGAYDPGAWKAAGYSYAQWHSAASAYMASVHSSWGNLPAGGGGATTGNASNSNSTEVKFTVNNSGGDAPVYMCDTDGDGVTDTISTTGPHSNNSITTTDLSHTSLNNNNKLGAHGINGQFAGSGDAASTGNTNALGGTGSGGASNANGTKVNGHVTNGTGGGSGGGKGSGGGGGGNSSSSIHNTGPYSNNTISNKTIRNSSVTNNNNLSSYNYNKQIAGSGSASSTHNTNAGSATSGSSSNYSSSSTNFSVSN